MGRGMIVLGIDPGTARLGYGLIEATGEPRLLTYGVVETHQKDSMPQRLYQLHETVCQLIARHGPEVLALEQLFFARNVTTAIAVGQARGVVLLAAAQANLAVREYTPSEVKHSIVGYGKADKSQVQEMVRIILGMDAAPSPDDAADALAIAICEAHTSSGYGAVLR
jgi:crossover junction endodeoxyribonuclease RuvC